MKNERDDFKMALHHYVDAKKKQTIPVSAQELLALHDDDMGEQDKQNVLERLVLDGDGVQHLLNLQSISMDDAPEVPAAELDVSWSEFQKKFASEEPANLGQNASSGLKSDVHKKPSLFQRPQIMAALAACFFLSTVALSYWVVQLKMNLTNVGQTDNTNVVLMDIYLEGTERSNSENIFEKDEGFFQIHLNRSWNSYSLFRVDFFSPADVPVKTVSELISEDHTLSFSLKHRSFPEPGLYKIRVSGLRNGETHELGNSNFRVLKKKH